jgi:hypothetical protein
VGIRSADAGITSVCTRPGRPWMVA